ncbi:MAG: hypothetical protein IKS29_05250 [Oscillospiraceae bacterium]|nr:hypothetical protein [Oscillospiraceae bacterium]
MKQPDPKQLQQAQQLLSSPQGQALKELLLRDGGKTLRQAAERLQAGDEAGAKALISPLLNSSEGRALRKELNPDG